MGKFGKSGSGATTTVKKPAAKKTHDASSNKTPKRTMEGDVLAILHPAPSATQRDTGVTREVQLRPNEVCVLDDFGSFLYYCPKFYEDEVAPTAPGFSSSPGNPAQLLIDRCPWQQGSVMMFGKAIPEPRLTCYFGDLGYRYSGRDLQPVPFDNAPKLVPHVKSRIEAHLSIKLRSLSGGRPTFNSVLLNRYRSGQDSQGWHSDSESVYGTNPEIASITFGAERDFCFRAIKDHSVKMKFKLGSGSLLFMGGPIQHRWQHSLPRRSTKPQPFGAPTAGERINLTFRRVLEGVKPKRRG